MASEEIKRDGLAALSLAAVERIEDHHDELVTMISKDREAQRDRMLRLCQLGTDLLALGKAGLVLLNAQAHASEDAANQPY